MENLNAHYWNQRYIENYTGWDIGQVSRPLKAIIDGLEDKKARILVPGAGNGYEVEYLYQQGYTNTYILDWAPKAMEQFLERFPSFPKSQCIVEDFFEHEETYDIILEQTFFCALLPHLREAYVQQIHALLKPGGLLTGVLFNTDFGKEGPPFGGHTEDYVALFSDYFSSVHIKPCTQSIEPRMGKEVFIKCRRNGS